MRWEMRVQNTAIQLSDMHELGIPAHAVHVIASLLRNMAIPPLFRFYAY